MRYLYFLFSLFLLSVVVSCKKHKDDYTIANDTERRIYFNIYGSERDYSLGENCLVSGYVEGKKKLFIPQSKIGTNSPIWIDWYSEDLLYSNWLMPSGVKWDNNVAHISDVLRCYARKLCLSNGSSRWKLVDAFSGSTSIYSTLSDYDRSLEIVINKTSVELCHTDSYGNIREQTSTRLEGFGIYDIDFNQFQGLDLNSAIPSVPGNVFTIYSKDTIVYINNSMQYLMVKE